jgi:hypothetical protein
MMKQLSKTFFRPMKVLQPGRLEVENGGVDLQTVTITEITPKSGGSLDAGRLTLAIHLQAAEAGFARSANL